MSEELALITESDLSLVEDNRLNGKQLKQILKRTPKQYVKQRPAKGGGQWDYVSGGYVKKCLNIIFGWDWDFEIVSSEVEYGEVVVLGRLTCRTNGNTIVKMQYGNKDIVCKKGTKDPISIGNDKKAAATDALKKCASEIGIAADIYNKEDFREVNVTPSEDVEQILKDLFNKKEKELISDYPDMYEYITRIIENKEKSSYKKAIKTLNQI